MKILYHFPHIDSINAYRTIYSGYRNAFIDLGHNFRVLTASDDLISVLGEFNPDIFITASHFFYRKFIDYKILKTYREKGLVVFTKIDFWNSPPAANRINEAKSMKNDQEAIKLLSDDLLGDIFFHVVEQGDERMKGFKEFAGKPYITIPLAADKIALEGIYEEKYRADISFIGTNLPAKRDYFNKYLFPLKKNYDFKLYGQDWTLIDRTLGWVQRAGQYFNIPVLKSIRKPKLALGDEGKIYKSSLVSINIHEEHQKAFGGDCNERTFKIPFCGGFEILDDVACVNKYFKEGEEIVITKNENDWFEKINYYIKNPEKRLPIIQAGRNRVLRDHTYHNRVEQMISLYDEFINK